MTRKYEKKSDYWKDKGVSTTNNKMKAVNKATNPSVSQERTLMLSPEIGTLGLNRIQSFTRMLEPYDLAFPSCLSTYHEMINDSDVATALDTSYTLLSRCFSDFKIKANNNSFQSKKAAKLIDYNLRNMETTLSQVLLSMFNYKQFGFALAEKVYATDEDESSPYYGTYRLTKIAVRPQTTLDFSTPFSISSDGRDVLGFNQNITSSIFSSSVVNIPENYFGKRFIPIEKTFLLGYNITESNPIGESPLKAIYRDWKEKSLINEYEVIGVSKDVAGLPILKVPEYILNRAAIDKTGNEAQSLQILQQNIANIHAGEQSYMVLPSDVYDSTSMSMYQVDFKGSSSNKLFDTGELIERRREAIYRRFGLASLLSESGDISDNNQSLVSFNTERDKNLVVEAINKQIIPQLLRLNGFNLAQQDLPVFESISVNPPNISDNSSAIQRVVSVGAIPITPEVVDEFLSMLGLSYRVPDEVKGDSVAWAAYKEEFFGESTSRSGDGLATGTGNGTSTSVANTDTSVSNVAN